MLKKLAVPKRVAIGGLAVISSLLAWNVSRGHGNYLPLTNALAGGLGGASTAILFTQEWGLCGDKKKRTLGQTSLHGLFFLTLAVACADPSGQEDNNHKAKDFLSVAGVIGAATLGTYIRGSQENDLVVEGEKIGSTENLEVEQTLEVENLKSGRTKRSRERKALVPTFDDFPEEPQTSQRGSFSDSLKPEVEKLAGLNESYSLPEEKNESEEEEVEIASDRSSTFTVSF